MTVEPEDMQTWARVYAHMGWKVFPLWWLDADGRCACPLGVTCASPGKHPVIPPAHRKGDPAAGCKSECGRAGHGVWDATDRLDVIGAWWDRAPLANIGLAAHANGLAILDVDPKSGGDESFDRLAAVAAARGVDLAVTLTARTGSGGRHLLYAAPADGIKSGTNVFGRDMPGLDTRGRGGYVVAAPSRHASGRRYEWAATLGTIEPAAWPALLTQLMEPPRTVPAQSQQPVRLSRDNGSAYALAALRGECDQVRAAIPGDKGGGGRNHRLNIAACKVGGLVAGGLLDGHAARAALYEAGRACGLEHRETEATIESGFRAGARRPRGAAS